MRPLLRKYIPLKKQDFQMQHIICKIALPAINDYNILGQGMHCFRADT